MLRARSGATLTLAATEDVPGHRPLRGAVIDVRPDARDAPDPIVWWRPVWIDRQQRTHPVIAREVRESPCADGSPGAVVRGAAHAVEFETRVCFTGPDRYTLTTRVDDLPSGVRLADEINPGTAAVLVANATERWQGEVATPWMTLSEGDVAVTLEAAGPAPVARRQWVHIASETFPSPVLWIHDRSEFVRHVRVQRGDTLDALAAVSLPRGSSPQVIDLVGPERLPATVDLRLRDGSLLTTGELTTPRRRVVLPAPLVDHVIVRDARGVASGPLEVSAALHAVSVHTPPLVAATLALNVTDEDERALPVKVVVRREGPGAEASPRLAPGERGFTSGRALYLLDGRASVHLPPGSWRVLVSRGPAYTLHEESVTLEADARRSMRVTLRRVLPAGDWIAGDFHLHAAPSYDSRVTLDERLASLACNGVEVAAATDHNRVTDYREALARTGLASRLTVITGDEITSAGAGVWGHFNAFPLEPPPRDLAPEDAALAYYERSPGAMFRAARNAGARVVMVNHARMPPSIGYLDQTHFDARTGAADDVFSGDFNALEVFNGLWIETPARVREGLVDLVGLARRGVHPTALGNSDSHQLAREEAGYPRTYVRVRSGPRETLTARVLDALREGRTTVTSGPLVEITVNGAAPGETLRGLALRDGAPVRVHVRVSAPAWVPVERVEIWRNDVVAERVAVQGPARDGVRYEGDHEIPVLGDTVIFAWADATRPLPGVLALDRPLAMGFTGPVRVDFDGDGTVRVPPAP